MKKIKLVNKIPAFDLNKIITIKSNYYGPRKKLINYLTSSKINNPSGLLFLESENNFNLKKIKGTVILKKKNKNPKSQIVTSDPRLFFVKVLDFFFKKKINSTHYPKENFRDKYLNHFKKSKIFCSKNSFIAKNVTIGKKSYIGKNVVIYPNCILGNNVKILDNSVIGCYGLGYLKKRSLMPHLGLVIIKNNVSIGANCTIVRGTLDNTVIGENVKMANNINIGHNVVIKKNCLISSSVSIAGGAEIKENSILGIGAKIKNNINIGKNVKVGIGSVVVRNIKKSSSVFGNPSRYIQLSKKTLW